MIENGVRVLLPLVLAMAVTFSGCGQAGSVPGANRRTAGARLFLSHPGYVDNPTEPKDYAKQLVAAPDGEAYVILILAGNFAFEERTLRPLAMEEPGAQSVVVSFQNAYVAAIIDALPEKLSPAVLWALTQRLDDLAFARWSLHPDEGMSVQWVSRPLRDLARAALVRRLHVDHAYDRTAWRQTIQRLVRSPAGNVGNVGQSHISHTPNR